MTAKCIKFEKNPKGLNYLNKYYFECIECGSIYWRHKNDSRTSPFCGKCQKKHDYERQKERLKAKKNQSIIEELEKIKTEIFRKSYTQGQHFNPHYIVDYDDINDIFEHHISELKGDKK